MKGAWSVEEDEKLVTLIGQGFSNWSELAANTGRTAKQVSKPQTLDLTGSFSKRLVAWRRNKDQSAQCPPNDQNSPSTWQFCDRRAVHNLIYMSPTAHVSLCVHILYSPRRMMGGGSKMETSAGFLSTRSLAAFLCTYLPSVLLVFAAEKRWRLHPPDALALFSFLRLLLQCRERWMHHLDPSLRHVSWTAEEDQLLVTLEVR